MTVLRNLSQRWRDYWRDRREWRSLLEQKRQAWV